MGNAQSNQNSVQHPSKKLNTRTNSNPKTTTFSKKLSSSITSLFKTSYSSNASKVQSATLPMRKHIPLSQRGTPLAMNCFQNYIVIVTPQQLVEFQNKYPLDLQNNMRKVTTLNPFTAAKLTYSQFFRSQIAFISTSDNKISVFNLNELTQIYALDVGGGSKIVSIEIQKLSDTFWLGFEHGVAQCWTFGESECKAKYIPVEGRQMMPVAKIDFSRKMQLLMIMHQKVKIAGFIKAYGINNNFRGEKDSGDDQAEQQKRAQQVSYDDDKYNKLEHDAQRGIRVYDALSGCAYGIQQCDYSENQTLLSNSIIVDLVVIQSKNIVILQGSIANLLIFYDLQMLRDECMSRKGQQDHGGRLFDLKPILQHSATYPGITINLAVTSLCIARTDDNSKAIVRQALVKFDDDDKQEDQNFVDKGHPVLILGLQNGSALTCLVHIQFDDDDDNKKANQIQVKPQQFYKPKGTALLFQNKSLQEGANGFIPPVLHAKLLQYCSHSDILISSNQGCIISILPGILRTIQRTEKGQKFQQIGFKQSKLRKEQLPLFSLDTSQKPRPSKKQPTQIDKNLKLLSLGEKNDETVKNFNWKGMVSSVKNLMKRKKVKNNQMDQAQKGDDDDDMRKLHPVSTDQSGKMKMQQEQKQQQSDQLTIKNNAQTIPQQKKKDQPQYDQVLQILNRYSKQIAYKQNAPAKDQAKEEEVVEIGQERQQESNNNQDQKLPQPYNSGEYRSPSIQQIELS